MTKITYPHIEDYLEVLAGFRLPPNKSSSAVLFPIGQSPISLARYDQKIVHSMADQCQRGLALTDKQSDLAVKLVSKYQRQFNQNGIDLGTQSTNPQFRIPIRLIDRTHKLLLDNNQLVLRFPYNTEIIQIIKKIQPNSQGSCSWHNENREWRVGLTEGNLSWCMSIADKFNFIVDDAVKLLFNKLLDCEREDFRIELEIQNKQLTIKNAAPSLINYVNQNLGGLANDNLIRLIDWSSILGYTVHPDIGYVLENEFNSIVTGLFFEKHSHVPRLDLLDTGTTFLSSVVQYAELTDRWPIYVYEPDSKFLLYHTLTQMLPEESISNLNEIESGKIDIAKVKVVYFTNTKRWLSRQRIPLLVSTNAMLFGPEKSAILQATEKLVYYTATTYNGEKKSE